MKRTPRANMKIGKQFKELLSFSGACRGAAIVVLSTIFLLIPLSGAASAEPTRGAVKCGYAQSSANLVNVTKVRLAAFNMKVRFCYDGVDVTEAKDPELFGSVTDLGHDLGWEYKKEYDHFDKNETTWSAMGPQLNPSGAA